jgi:glyoxylase-like metal-dependent hydrolase (beta-lactamase superfamily II)
MDSMAGLQLPEVERWSERVVVVRGLNPGWFTGPGTNTFLIGTGPDPLLLDTGAGKDGYVPLLEGALSEHCRTDAPGDVLLTHVHPDHIGGARDVIERFGPRRVCKMPWPERDARFGLELTATGEGDVFRTQGATLRALYTPGHAQDHLCYYLDEERALFTGDVILGAGTTVIPTEGGDMRLYFETLERLLGLDVARIYPAHGPRIDAARDKIREYIDHRRARETQIIEALRAGVGVIPQIVERIYVDAPRALYPAAGQSVLAHLLKLEREGSATRTDRGDVEHWASV